MLFRWVFVSVREKDGNGDAAEQQLAQVKDGWAEQVNGSRGKERSCKAV